MKRYFKYFLYAFFSLCLFFLFFVRHNFSVLRDYNVGEELDIFIIREYDQKLVHQFHYQGNLSETDEIKTTYKSLYSCNLNPFLSYVIKINCTKKGFKTQRTIKWENSLKSIFVFIAMSYDEDTNEPISVAVGAVEAFTISI